MVGNGSNTQRALRIVLRNSDTGRVRTTAVPREPRQCGLDTVIYPKRLISSDPGIGTHGAMRTPGCGFAQESRATPL